MNAFKPSLQALPKHVTAWAKQNRWIAAYAAAMLLSLLLAFCGGSPPEAPATHEGATPAEAPAPAETLSTGPVAPGTAAPDTLPDFGLFLPRKFQEMQMEDPFMRGWSFFVDPGVTWTQIEQQFQNFIGPSWQTPSFEDMPKDFDQGQMSGDDFHLTQFRSPLFPNHTIGFGLVRDDPSFVIVTLHKQQP